MKKPVGKIIIAADVNVWPHELETAKALAATGRTVEFVRRSEVQFAISADALIDGVLWEMKAPVADNLKAVERNVKRARIQSENVVIDSRRMKKIPDFAIEKALRKHAKEVKGVARMVFVNRHGVVIDLR